MGALLSLMLTMVIIGAGTKLAQDFVYFAAALVQASKTIVGTQIGAATIKKFRPNTLKLIFGIYFFYVAVKFIGNYFGLKIW